MEVLLKNVLEGDEAAREAAAASVQAPRPLAGDTAVALAALRDYRKHETYFTRLFQQTEWGRCSDGGSR